MPRRSNAHALFLVVAALTTGCATATPLAPIPPSPSVAPAPGLPPLPASFAGVLPCADCAGIRYRLDLRPAGVYFLRMAYLGQGDEATLDDVGQWSMSNDGEVLVLRGGREAPEFFSVESADRLRKRDLQGRAIESSLPYDLTRDATYTPLAPRLRLRGMFTYLADAALFEECLTGSRLPVAMAEDYLALERAYVAAGAGGTPILAALAGRIEPQPPMEGEGLVESLVVERFERLSPGETCGARGVTAELVGTYWKLVRLGEEAVLVGEGQREPHLVLTAEGAVQGFGGCNRMMGSYTLDGAELAFGAVATTRMACLEGMDAEAAFTAALTATRTWRILGTHLELYDETGNLAVRLEARELE